MKIGDGILELGILEVHHRNGRKISVTELGKLARQTLSFYPLGRIFTVSEMKTKTVPFDFFRRFDLIDGEIDLFRKEKNPDLIAIVNHEGENFYEPGTGIVYSAPDPRILAHEIGHSLGLKHPVAKCNGLPACSREYSKNQCPYSKEIMGCAGIIGAFEERIEFSQNNLEKLEGWYLN